MAKKILGVTGCPTGIAHTFMAEEALKKAAAELGCEIKVETNGAIGVENAPQSPLIAWAFTWCKYMQTLRHRNTILRKCV